jgi:PTS system mannose-specific IIA component
MVGLVLFSHDKLSEAFLEALEMIAGPQEQLEAVDVKTGMSTEDIERALDKAIKSVDSGDGVVIITDLFGGSPANFALARMAAGKVEVISGLNRKDSIVLASQVLLREKGEQPGGAD